jgi:hypothetical protein
MDKEKYYEILVNKNKYQGIYGDDSRMNDDCDDFERILYFSFRVKEISLEEIDYEIDNLNETESCLLFQELRYVKEYQMLTKKYSKAFTILKYNKKGKPIAESAKLENQEDIIRMLSLGVELVKSPKKPLYIGICLAIILDRVNRVDEAIEIVKQIRNWYPENYEINRYLKKFLRDIYFRNRMYQRYWGQIADYNDNVLKYLSRNIKFFHFNFNLFVFVYVLLFLLLWVVLGIKALIVIIALILYSVINMVLCYKRNELLLYIAYNNQLFYYVLLFAIDSILFNIVN